MSEPRLRKLCRCGHARSSHANGEGACNPQNTIGCSCKMWVGAYPVFDLSLPAGVIELRSLRSGLSIVECHHEGPRDAAVRGCSLCRGDAQTTAGYTLPVKLLAFAPTAKALFG